MRRRLAWIALVVLATYVIFIGGTWPGIYFSGFRVVTMIATAIVLAGWALAARTSPTWRPRSVLMVAIAASLASLTVSTVTSRHPRVSLEYLAYAVVLAALYLLLVRLMADGFFRRRLAALATMLLVATGLIYVGVVIVHWTDWWVTLGAFSPPPLRPGFEGLSFGNPSAVLTMVALVAVPAIASLIRRPRLWAVLAVGGLVAAVALLSGSRAGWLGLAIAAVIVGGVALVRRPGRDAAWRLAHRAWSSTRGRVAVIVTAVVAVTLVAVFGGPLLQRAGAGGEELRAGFWVTAIRLFVESPIVGTGPGTWAIERIRATRSDETDFYIPHAHNLEVQTLAELGILGALAGVVVVGSLFLLVRGAIRDPDPERRAWGWATAFGLVYFAAHQLLDVYVNMPAFLFVAALPVAYLDATGERAPRGRASPPLLGRVAVPAASVVVAIAIGGLLLQEVPALKLADAAALANAGQWSAADAPARAAAAQDPEISPYEMTAGLTASRVGDPASALRYFETVAARDDLPEAWLDRAAVQAALGQPADALASIRAALRLGHSTLTLAMPAGDLAMRLGIGDSQAVAIDAFADSIGGFPSLAGDPWWTSDPSRAALFPEILRRAMDRAAPGDRWEIALMVGDGDQARQLATGPDAPAFAADVLTAWTGGADGLTAMLHRCNAHPLDLAAVAWCARLDVRQADLPGAERFRHLAALAGGGGVRIGELRVNPTSPETQEPFITTAGWQWGTYTYRRPTPQDLLLPGLLHIRLE